MSVNNVNNTSNYSAYTSVSVTASQKKTEASDGKVTKTSESLNVTVSASTEVTKNEAFTVKSSYQPDTNKIQELFDAQKNYMRGLQNMVNQLLSQAGSSRVATFGEGSFNMRMDMKTAEQYHSLLVRNNDGTYSFDPTLGKEEQAALKAKATEDISENGYFGVKNTSERILDFAKAISGGDPAKAEEMRNMVKKAFDEVEKMFGGKLPEISHQTYDAIMKGFDEWSSKTKTAEV